MNLRVAGYLLMALTLAAGVVWAAATPSTIEVDADRLDIDSIARSARFEGHVNARYRDIAISCSSMQVTWDAAQRLVSLRASGGVRLQRSDAVATADRATLLTAGNVLSLDGSPVLVQGGNRLSGKQIQVNLETSKIEVIEARGTFILGADAR